MTGKKKVGWGEATEKPRKKARKAKPSREEEAPDDFGLDDEEADEPDEEADGEEIDEDDLDALLADEEEAPAPPKATTKKTTKKATKKATKQKATKADEEFGLDDEGDGEETDQPPWDAAGTADRLGIDVSSECPVCRSLDGCECEEDDRAFQRRVRFEADVKKTARCPRCQAPLSVIYLRRPNAGEGPFRLAQFAAFWGCACCHGTALASVALGAGR